MTTDAIRFRALLAEHGLSQSAFSRQFGIPLRTVQNWATGERTPPAYIIKMAAEILDAERK